MRKFIEELTLEADDGYLGRVNVLTNDKREVFRDAKVWGYLEYPDDGSAWPFIGLKGRLDFGSYASSRYGTIKFLDGPLVSGRHIILNDGEDEYELRITRIRRWAELDPNG